MKRQYLKVRLATLAVAMVIPSGFAAAQLGRRVDDRGGEPYGRSPADVARLRAMDIAGVRLGMTPDQVKNALRITGYQPVRFASGTADVGTDQDYSSRVESLRRRRLDQPVGPPGRQIVVAERWSKGDERVEVNYVALRDAVQVARVRYAIPEGRMTWPSIKATVASKYGQPTQVSDFNQQVRYCGDGACAVSGTGGYAQLELRRGWVLALSDGSAAQRLSQRQIVEDAEGLIARTAKPSF